MSKTLRGKIETPGVAGQLLWLPDLDTSNPVPTPTGYAKLSTTGTTTITNASTLYPALYALYTSTSSSSPIYRNGNHLVVQQIHAFPKRTRAIPVSFSAINFTPTINLFTFFTDSVSGIWRMHFHLAGNAATGGTYASISGVSLMYTSINCACTDLSSYTSHTAATADNGVQLLSNHGGYTVWVEFWGEVLLTGVPTTYLTPENMETAPMTPFIRLYSD